MLAGCSLIEANKIYKTLYREIRTWMDFCFIFASSSSFLIYNPKALSRQAEPATIMAANIGGTNRSMADRRNVGIGKQNT